MKKEVVKIFVIIILLLLIGFEIFVLFYSKNDEIVNNTKLEEIRLDVKESITLDYGSGKPGFKDFCDADIKNVDVEIYFGEEKYEEDSLMMLGEYKVKIIVGDEIYESKIMVLDKEAPVLQLKEISIKEGESYNVNSFVEKCEDNTKKDCILLFEKEEMCSYEKAGTYDIVVIAKDESSNEVREQTKLIITEKEKKNNTNSSEKNTTNNSQSNVPEVVTYKYGVKITTKGNKVTYDRSTFNATTNDLKEEAKGQKSIEANNINQILNETNKYRAELGLSPLVLNDDMTLAANIRAMEMAWGDNVSHTRPDGRSCFTIFSEVVPGYNFSYGENIAYGQKSGTSAATWWRNSPGHYANMTNEGFNSIGIGVYKFNGTYYYVQLFAN